jgi:hypothetical protein
MRDSTTVIDVAVETLKRLHWVQEISVSNIVQVSGCCDWMSHRIAQSVRTNTRTAWFWIVQLPSNYWVSNHLMIRCLEDWATESVVKQRIINNHEKNWVTSPTAPFHVNRSLKAPQIHNTPPDGTRATEPVLWSTREVVADVPADASYEYDRATVLTDRTGPDRTVKSFVICRWRWANKAEPGCDAFPSFCDIFCINLLKTKTNFIVKDPVRTAQ